MKQKKGFSRRFKTGFIIAAGLLLACGLVYIAELKITKVETLPEVRPQQTLDEYPDSILKTRSPGEFVRDHLLDGDFNIVRDKGDLIA